MNQTLQLKGKFEQRSNNFGGGPRNIPMGNTVNVDHLLKLKNDLGQMYSFWRNNKILDHPLVSIYYNRIIAKSNRIETLVTKGNMRADQTVVGARFNKKGNKHIITHCITLQDIQKAIERIDKCIGILNKICGGQISHDIIEAINVKDIKYGDKFYYLLSEVNCFKKEFISNNIPKTKFVNTIVDAFYVEKIGLESELPDLTDQVIISIYDIGEEVDTIFDRLGISYFDQLNNTTLLMTNDQYRSLLSKAPYLVSMALADLAELDPNDIKKSLQKNHKIASPGNEPTIGVIDTLFDNSVYFHKWVEEHNKIKDDLIEDIDYVHGTIVSSIIVDGPSLNPMLDDGCGHFKVRHFGVSKGTKFSSFEVLKQIDEIVRNNRDIKVWNLSLGEEAEISLNFISPEAALLDEIQFENGVIFVVAATNKQLNDPEKRIGAPADSVNSLVVGSVDYQKHHTRYSRKGGVLSFYVKPDLCYYGGTENERMNVYAPSGDTTTYGTSLAAPWIARKLAYLIEIMKFPREVAKALLIDASIDWKERSACPEYLGYGVPPVRITDILQSKDDEIKFVLSGKSELYNTYTYKLPVPSVKEKHPYIARATLCYFPKCSRNQGVDYTNTEFDFKIGRLNKGQIKSIDDNPQDTRGFVNLPEEDARRFFRKWDNVKHVSELLKKRNFPKKKYEEGLWGISLKTKERLGGKDGKDLLFGIVVTLKEINGINRIDEFVQSCFAKGWLVEKVDINVMLDVYQEEDAEVEFED